MHQMGALVDHPGTALEEVREPLDDVGGITPLSDEGRRAVRRRSQRRHGTTERGSSRARTALSTMVSAAADPSTVVGHQRAPGTNRVATIAEARAGSLAAVPPNSSTETAWVRPMSSRTPRGRGYG